MRRWCKREIEGVVSIKSTRSWISQCSTLTKVRIVNMATNSTLNSSRKIVMARQVSMTAWLIRSLIRSTSDSRNCPRNICSGLLVEQVRSGTEEKFSKEHWARRPSDDIGFSRIASYEKVLTLVVRLYKHRASANARFPSTAMATFELAR